MTVRVADAVDVARPSEWSRLRSSSAPVSELLSS